MYLVNICFINVYNQKVKQKEQMALTMICALLEDLCFDLPMISDIL